MRRDSGQRLAAHVAVRGPGVRAGVPVVHPREVVHAVLGGLREEKEKGQRSEVTEVPRGPGGGRGLTSKCSRFCTLRTAAIQSSISFLFSAHRISFRHGVMI